MSEATTHLVSMANQIARFFQSQGTVEAAIAATAQHIKDFWAPKMRRDLLALVDAGGAGELTDIAKGAIERFR